MPAGYIIRKKSLTSSSKFAAAVKLTAETNRKHVILLSWLSTVSCLCCRLHVVWTTQYVCQWMGTPRGHSATVTTGNLDWEIRQQRQHRRRWRHYSVLEWRRWHVGRSLQLCWLVMARSSLGDKVHTAVMLHSLVGGRIWWIMETEHFLLYNALHCTVLWQWQWCPSHSWAAPNQMNKAKTAATLGHCYIALLRVCIAQKRYFLCDLRRRNRRRKTVYTMLWWNHCNDLYFVLSLVRYFMCHVIIIFHD